jgi:spiro-SPASM protein
MGDARAGSSTVDAVERFVNSLGISDKRVLVVPQDAPSHRYTTLGWQTSELPEWSWQAVLNALANEIANPCTIVLVPGNAPFLNKVLFDRLLQLHETYAAHFTFADAYPAGLGVDLIDSRVLRAMQGLAERNPLPITEQGLFDLIRLDVNAFDVETEIANDDMRMLRLSFTDTSTERRLLIKRFQALLPAQWHLESPEAIACIIRANQHALRLIPAWFNLQLSTSCPQTCSYCPWGIQGYSRKPQVEMPLEQAQQLVLQIAAWNPEAALSVSLWGEPALYSQIEAFILGVLEKTRLALYIETAAIGWDLPLLERLSQHPESKRLFWIASLDSADPQVYRKMRGEGFAEAWAGARILFKLFPERVWFQAVRCTENELVIQAFYAQCKEEKIPCIIQKYDHFNHRIPDQRVSDIGPFSRFACWHLKRDMHILVDGKVPRCREDFLAEHCLGNVFEQTLMQIWEQGQGLYQDHVARRFEGMCENCDEYYTFNA